MSLSFKMFFGQLATVLALFLVVTQGAGAADANAPTPAPTASAIAVQPWREDTWAQVRDKGPRPAAYLFTASYCSTCPEAFQVLYHASQGHARKVTLAPVLMDVNGEQALRHASHFPGLTQLYAFEGFEPAIRQGIDPQWADVTPYVVLIDRKGQRQRILGTPNAAAIQRWLQ